MPTKVLYKKGNNVIVSYQAYLNLKKKKKKGPIKLTPLIEGKVGQLDEKSEKDLLTYMGIQ
ncbi:MAG TPA: hypothetical protein DDW49_11015 [Deltaproteobacteria bacterium]|nr:hypothetical protein [Deltaproteobacteria bacterium]